MSNDQHVLYLLPDILASRPAEEVITAHGHTALSSLISALCWQDNNPNRAEYITRLGDLHRNDSEPVLSAIITAAQWLLAARDPINEKRTENVE